MAQSLSFVEAGPVSFGERLAGSQAFKALFREGMSLVDDTAAYLDGPGREEAKNLPRMVALAYAAESMRLTTRLMQLASWLLLQRAVNEGEMTQLEASAEKNKVRLAQQDVASRPEVLAQLPQRLRDLVDTSLRLHTRIFHFDQLINPPATPRPRQDQAPRSVESQIARLRDAFEQRPA